MFVGAGVDVYEGQIVGIHQRPGDLGLNICKKKAATNIRSNKDVTGSHITLRLVQVSQILSPLLTNPFYYSGA